MALASSKKSIRRKVPSRHDAPHHADLDPSTSDESTILINGEIHGVIAIV